ncbi:MAG: hypothetical protein IIC82_02960 [Chloroflexi bacterium]|nr:hypothetical protein [Chloroflexota bacterium]
MAGSEELSENFVAEMARVAGIELTPEQLGRVVTHARSFASAGAKLRALDLAGIEPALVFRPAQDAG